MKKIIKLTESDLMKLVKKVIKEQDETNFPEPEPELYTIAMSDAKPPKQDDVQLAEDDIDEEYDEEYDEED